MNKDFMKAENIRKFITEFELVVVEKSKEPKRVNLLDHFYGKYEKDYQQKVLANPKSKKGKSKTRAVWLIDEIVKQTQTDSSDSGKKLREQLAYSSVNAGLSKTDPSEKLVDAAMDLHLRWLEDFFSEMKTTLPSMDDDKLNAEKRLIVKFYEKIKASQEKGDVTDNAWKDLEDTVVNAEVLVVFNPEVKVRGYDFDYQIWDRYAAIIKNYSSNTARIPRIFVIHDRVIFPSIPSFLLKQTEPEVEDGDDSLSVKRKPEDDFFEEVYNLLKDKTLGISKLELRRLIQEKVFMIGIASSLCIRPELFVDPQNPDNSSGFGFFIEHGKGWRPYRLESDVCKLWRRTAGPKIPYSHDFSDPQNRIDTNKYLVARFSDSLLYTQLNNEAPRDSIDNPLEPVENLKPNNSSTRIENKVH